MKEIYRLRGHFKAVLRDKKGKIIDSVEDKNLIMDLGRADMVKLIGNRDGGTPINKIVLGTEGYKNGDLLTPKEAGTDYDSTRTQLFSEEGGQFYYSITFTSDSTTDTWEGTGTGVKSNDTSNSETVSVKRTIASNQVTYTISIPADAGNDGNAVAYTEAGLYAGTSLFAMKTFSAKTKDDTSTLEITWSIIF